MKKRIIKKTVFFLLASLLTVMSGCQHKVSDNKITSVSFDSVPELMEKGSQITFKTIILPDSASNKILEWSSSDSETASVNENGLVTALKTGKVTITACSTDGSGKKASHEITIVDSLVYVQSVTVIKQNKDQLFNSSAQLKLIAKILPENATIKEVNWSSSNENIAQVDGNGLVTCIAETGKVEIIATAKDGSNISGKINLSIEEEPEGELDFVLSNDKTYYSVSGIGTYTGTTLRIPEEYNSLPVTTIDEKAFYNNTKIKEIYIPESITEIGNNAFSNCNSLEKIYFNAINCKDFKSSVYIFNRSGNSETGIELIIGNKVTRIPSYHCNGNYSSDSPLINKITFEDNSELKSIGDSSFWNLKTLTEIVLPESVESIERYAFGSCSELKKIYLGKNVHFIGISAFASLYKAEEVYVNCIKLDEVESTPSDHTSRFSNLGRDSSSVKFTIGDDVEYIPSFFLSSYWVNYSSIANVTELYVGKSVNKIDKNSLGGLRNLQKLYYNAINATGPSAIFEECGTETENGCIVTIGKDVENIPGRFLESSFINELCFEENSSCKQIGSDLIDGSKVKKISLPSSVEKFGSSFSSNSMLEEIYYNCKNAEYSSNFYGFLFEYNYSDTGFKVIIGKDVEAIPSKFMEGSSATDKTGPVQLTFEKDSVCKIINSNAFSKCNDIVQLDFPESLTTIKKEAFKNSNLPSLRLDSNIKEIDEEAFYYCGTLETIYFDSPSQTSRIFQETSAKKLIIGKHVNKVSSWFYKLPDLETVVFEEDSTCTCIGGDAFSQSTKLKSIKLPSSVTEIQDRAFISTSLEEIILNRNLTYIGKSPFSTKPKKVYYESTEADWKNISFGGTVYDINDFLNNLPLYFYSETYQDGCWHYDTDNYTPVMW